MPAPGQSTFDGNPNATPPTTTGYRCGVNDFNGAALVDDTTNPPDPATMLTSAQVNTEALTIISLSRMTYAASFGVSAGASATIPFWSTAANKIANNPFTVFRQGNGHYQIGWTAGLFPLIGMGPRSSLHAGAGAGAITAQYMTSGPTAGMSGVEVWTTTTSGLSTDYNFSIDLY